MFEQKPQQLLEQLSITSNLGCYAVCLESPPLIPGMHKSEWNLTLA